MRQNRALDWGIDVRLYYDFSTMPLDGGTVVDGSVWGNDGMASGCEWTVNGCFNDGALVFFGNSSSVDVGTSLNFPSWNQYSVSLWFRHDGGGDLGPQYGHKMLDKTSLYHDWHLNLRLPESEGGGAGGVALFIYEGSADCGLRDASTNYADNVWHHLVLVRNGPHGELWLDGVLRDETERMFSVYSTSHLCVGNSFSPDYYQRKGWSGALDEIHVFDRALTPGEIASLHAVGEVVEEVDPASDDDEDDLTWADEQELGTDPLNADTDDDGLLDGEEVWLGSNPLAADSDADGFDDGEEILRYGTSPLLVDTDGDGIDDADEISGVTDPARADTDADGLDDAAELQQGTDPVNPDTDGDGALDGWEIDNGADPFLPDTDGDGLADGIEARIGSSPLLSDTDGDGLDDFDEYTSLGSSPILTDTDGDGISDVDEIECGTNPDDPDSDGDGLPDGEERTQGTAPLNPDTDGDGRSDGEEVADGTSPVLPDTDGDGLDDGDEFRRRTNGADPDTDHDGLPDGWEVAHSLDPRTAGGSNGATGDGDRDGISNAAEYALGTHPQMRDTDGDGLDDGEEIGCCRWRYIFEDEWASETNGWTAVRIDRDDEMNEKWVWFAADGNLRVGNEWLVDVVCQWNGLVAVSTEQHYLQDVITSDPVNLAGNTVSEAAVLVAPYWTESVAESAREPMVSVYRRDEGTSVRYAVQYTELPAGGTNTVTFQATLIFTNGVYKATEVFYREEMPIPLSGLNASMGVQNAIEDRNWSFSFRSVVGLSPVQMLQFINGTGTDPLDAVADTDGDGLSDAFELSVGTDPGQPDTDGDAMPDGWEWKYGFDPCVDNDDATSDTDSANDFDADPDGDGISNGEEADWGTDPHNADTDGDGVSDGDEILNCSDPADASDGGRPGERVPVDFYFGDPSGSHSEKYRLVVTPVRNPEGEAPTAGEMPKTFEWVNARYGECETKTADFVSTVLPWPRNLQRWHHSDIKNLAFIFNHRFFNEIVRGSVP